MNENNKNEPPNSYEWKYITAPVVKPKAAKLAIYGYGEGSTK
jgi:hypothetical protein